MNKYKKIAVIGCSGSGKTFLTFKLQEKLHLPVYHLDLYHYVFSWKFVEPLQWVWNFNNKHRSAIIETLHDFNKTKQIYIFKSFAGVNDFIDGL